MCISSLYAIVLVVLYSSIIDYLRRQIKNLDLSSTRARNKAKANRRVAYMMVIVIIVFHLLWITDSTLYAVEIFSTNVQIPCFLSWFVHIPLQMIYPIINPLIYYMFDKKYQQTFGDLLCCLHVSVTADVYNHSVMPSQVECNVAIAGNIPNPNEGNEL